MKTYKSFIEESIEILSENEEELNEAGKEGTGKILRGMKGEGWTFHSHGSSHDHYVHPNVPGYKLPIPRHNEVTDGVYRKIMKVRKSAMKGEN